MRLVAAAKGLRQGRSDKALLSFRALRAACFRYYLMNH